MAIPLAAKAVATPLASDDEVHAILTADPAVPEFPQVNQMDNSSRAPVLTAATNEIANISTVKADEHWVNKRWRPAMGWMYMLTCLFDFVIFPVLWSGLQAASKGQITAQWQPLTLQGAGLYHMAMGAVLGVAAYGRTKEKLNGTA